MHNSINIIVSLKKQIFEIEDTFIENKNNNIIDYKKFESSINFLFEHNPNLKNVFNEDSFKQNGFININIKVENKNLDSCVSLLNNKIKKLFKNNFQYNFETAIINDKRLSKNYNPLFEDIIQEYDCKKNNNDNFKLLNNKDITNCLEYLNDKIKTYKELTNKTSSSNIDMWIKIKNKEQNVFKITGNLIDYLENNSSKNTFLNAIKKIKI
jgi:hypothetical protein